MGQPERLERVHHALGAQRRRAGARCGPTAASASSRSPPRAKLEYSSTCSNVHRARPHARLHAGQRDRLRGLAALPGPGHHAPDQGQGAQRDPRALRDGQLRRGRHLQGAERGRRRAGRQRGDRDLRQRLGARARAAARPHPARKGDKRAILYELVTAARARPTPASGAASTRLTAEPMLNVDHVRAHATKDASCCSVRSSRSPAPRALELGEQLLALARGARRRDARRARARRCAQRRGARRASGGSSLGFVKLVEDACEFEAASTARSGGASPRALPARGRSARRSATGEQPSSAKRCSPRSPQALGAAAEALEAALYADLRGAQRLLPRADARRASAGRRATSAAQVQAVLLRAVRGRSADVRCRDARRVPRAVPEAQVPAAPATASSARPTAATASTSTGRSACSKPSPSTASSSRSRCRRSRRATRSTLAADVRWGKGSDAASCSTISMRRAARRTRARAASAARRGAELLDGVSTSSDRRGTARSSDASSSCPASAVRAGPRVPPTAGRSAPVYLEVLGFWSRDSGLSSRRARRARPRASRSCSR